MAPRNLWARQPRWGVDCGKAAPVIMVFPLDKATNGSAPAPETEQRQTTIHTIGSNAKPLGQQRFGHQ